MATVITRMYDLALLLLMEELFYFKFEIHFSQNNCDSINLGLVVIFVLESNLQIHIEWGFLLQFLFKKVTLLHY
jgi:hypothetical protein